ncbi:ArnT family glycosyltransferase [Aquiflexum gelatinilyticum]|uniref:ArnT family glycosyltransferase n=1 Tax=Aquiflexum gelatinilyticum TaxID=2961943 RepID=UPI002166FBBB|nr:glycosyltransferase family 39 protein [Aquiflexum gelatinilyticum]MCS4436650.1 glycosyltransferase family 39 protein [Aquiflexum gelatinilyticum]
MNWNSYRPYFILSIIGIVLLFFHLDKTPLYILDEVKNATCALEMKDKGEWIVPTFNNELRTDKPVLHYYFMQLGYLFFGANAFGARFFSACFGLALVLLSFYFTARILGKTTAWYQSILLLASLQFNIQFRLAVPDPYLIVWLYLTFVFLYLAIEEQKGARFAYVFAALGFLTKGLIAVVFPGMVVLIYLLWTKKFTIPVLKTLRIPEGILIFLLIGLPWYIAVGIQTQGEWLTGFFLKHNLSRYTETMEGHNGFFLLPFLLLFVALLPFSVFSFPATKKVLNKEAVPFTKFAFVVVLVVGLFFSFSKTMLLSYIGPAIPFLAIILAYQIEKIKTQGTGIGNNLILIFLLLISIAIPVASFFALEDQVSLQKYSNLAFCFLPIPMGSLVAILFWKKKRKNASLYSIAGGWGITVILVFSVVLPTIFSENPVNKSQQIWKDYDTVVAYKQFNPAFVWSRQKAIPVFHDLASLKNGLKEKDSKVLIISRSVYKDELLQLEQSAVILEHQDLFESSRTILISVKN